MFFTTDKNIQDLSTLPVEYNKLSPQKRREVRFAYIKKQNNLCYHCKCNLEGMPSMKVRGMKIHPELYPKGFFTFPIHLHHSHDTGMTIGAVHSYCNAVLWEHHDE